VTLVLDASAVIAHLDRRDSHHEAVKRLLLESVGHELMASPLTLAEVLVGPARAGQLDRALHALRTLSVQPVALADDAPVRLATLRAQTGLKLPDCCVLLAATSAAADVVTFDDRLAAAGRSLGFDVRGA
jgi:predicted nucleic acid-binding protein